MRYHGELVPKEPVGGFAEVVAQEGSSTEPDPPELGEQVQHGEEGGKVESEVREEGTRREPSAHNEVILSSTKFKFNSKVRLLKIKHEYHILVICELRMDLAGEQ